MDKEPNGDQSRSWEEQVYDLQKQLRVKEAVFKKDKAVLEQKLEMLELQIKEAKEREENNKKMHEAMLSALKPYSENNKTPKELQIASELHKKELEELSEAHAAATSSLKSQLEQLKKSVDSKDAALKELAALGRERDQELDKKKAELDVLHKEYEDKLSKVEEEKQRQKDAFELDLHLKTSNWNTTLEKLKSEHSEEISQIKTQSEASLKDIRYIYEQEKNSLEEQLAKAREEISNLQAHQSNENRTQNCLEEIRELNAHLDAFKKQSQEEIYTLKKQRDEYMKKAESLEEELVSIKHSMRNTQMIHEQSAKNFKQKLEKAQQLIETNENAQGELQRFKKLVVELKNNITKFEANEKRLKCVIVQKEKEVEEVREEYKQKINNERKKALQAHENYARAKEEYDHKKAAILKEIVAKDELIESLSKQLEKTHRKTLDGYTTISGNGRQASEKLLNFPCTVKEYVTTEPDEMKPRKVRDRTKGCNGAMNIESGGITEKIRRTELKQLQDCQKLVDAASRMECKKCKKLLEIESFLEHITRAAELCIDATLEDEDAENYCSEIEKLKEEKVKMAKRLKAVEVNLRGMHGKLQEFQRQRDAAQKELKKVSNELENAKTRCLTAEKDKTRTEYALKSEIKMLLEKLSDKERVVTKGQQNAKVTRELRSISTNDLHKNTAVHPRPKKTAQKTPNRTFLDHSAIETPNYYSIMTSCSPMCRERPAKESTRKTAAARPARKADLFGMSACSPNPIAKSLNYFVKNTPIMRTDNFTEPQKEEDILAEELSTEHMNVEDEEVLDFAYEFEGEDENDQCISYSPNEQAIPIPRTTIKNLSRFAHNYDLS